MLLFARLESHLKTNKKKIGFFGGTFDPIHLGHLNLAISILEQHELDQVLFCPASLSPHKVTEPTASKEQRREMVELAIRPIKSFSCFEAELFREGPSYTIDTMRSLKHAHPSVEYHLILGEDALERLADWKDIDELIALAPPLVGSRSRGISKTIHHLPSKIKKAAEKGMTSIPVMEISSTTLRQRLKEGKYCGHLLSAEVLNYIHEYRLYT